MYLIALLTMQKNYNKIDYANFLEENEEKN